MNLEYTIKGDITAHRFTTQAIAGAGGKETSVAGSVAIAVINGDTEALIAGAGDPSSNVVAVSRDMTVRALGSQVENTTASAAEDSRGKADANMGAGAGDKTEGSDEPATKASKIDTISNAVIQVGAGGSATTNERKVTLKPDEGRKLRSVSVKYTKPDGSTATMELPMNDGNTFTVPEISKSGSSCTITLGGQEIKVKSGSKLEYQAVFVTKSTVFAGDVDLNWKGEGSGTLTKGSVSNESTYTETSYQIKVDPKDGYTLQDSKLEFTYLKPDGEKGSTSIELTSEMLADGFSFTIQKKNDGTTTLILAADKKSEIKSDTIVNAAMRFIGGKTLGVQHEATYGDPSSRTDVAAAEKKANPNNTYTNTYTIKDGSKEAVTLKLMNLSAQKEGEELHAAAGDRIALIVKAAEGYGIDRLAYFYGDTSRDIVTVETSLADPDGGTGYVFYMPSKDAKIVVAFRKLDPEEQEKKDDKDKTPAGKTIGTGAGFAMTYSDLRVLAGIGENRTVSAGTADISAKAAHNTQTSGVAGIDPLVNATGDTAKDISLDASVAVTVVDDVIRAAIGKNTKLTLTGSNTVSLDETAAGSGHANFLLDATRES